MQTRIREEIIVNGVKAYACSLRGCPHEFIIHHTSRGKAKARFLATLDMDDIRYIDIGCRTLGETAQTDPAFLRCVNYRGVPFARIGMRVVVGGSEGRIVGHNHCSNLDVLFTGGKVMNCHPNWDITYFDEAGVVLAHFDGHDKKGPPGAEAGR